MKRPVRLLFAFSLLANTSMSTQFTLNLRPVAPGTGELCFTLEPGYCYCLESSGDFTGTFSPASSWMLGDGVERVIGIRDGIAPSEDA